MTAFVYNHKLAVRIFVLVGIVLGCLVWILYPAYEIFFWQREAIAVGIPLLLTLIGIIFPLVYRFAERYLPLIRTESKTWQRRLECSTAALTKIIHDAEAMPQFVDIMRGHLANANSASETWAMQVVQALEAIRNQSDSLLEKLKIADNIAQTQVQTRVQTQIQTKARNAKTLEQIMAYKAQRSSEIERDAQRITEVLMSIKDLTGLTKMIHTISLQTKILALNAAIEAARAGEAGRSFAVVADETRKLANESAKVATLIEERIREVTEMAEQNLSSMIGKERTAEEERQITRVIADLESMSEDFKQVSDYLSVVTSESHEAMDQICTDILNALSQLQLQDISRQQIEQVDAALEELKTHFACVLDNLSGSKWRDVSWISLAERIETFRDNYVMHRQRTTHDEVTSGKVEVDERPAIELF